MYSAGEALTIRIRIVNDSALSASREFDTVRPCVYIKEGPLVLARSDEACVDAKREGRPKPPRIRVKPVREICTFLSFRCLPIPSIIWITTAWNNLQCQTGLENVYSGESLIIEGVYGG